MSRNIRGFHAMCCSMLSWAEEDRVWLGAALRWLDCEQTISLANRVEDDYLLTHFAA